MYASTASVASGMWTGVNLSATGLLVANDGNKDLPDDDNDARGMQVIDVIASRSFGSPRIANSSLQFVNRNFVIKLWRTDSVSMKMTEDE